MKELKLINNEDYQVKITLEKSIGLTHRLAIVRAISEQAFEPQTIEFYLTNEELRQLKEWL
jgi:hypothetical protein